MLTVQEKEGLKILKRAANAAGKALELLGGVVKTHKNTPYDDATRDLVAGAGVGSMHAPIAIVVATAGFIQIRDNIPNFRRDFPYPKNLGFANNSLNEALHNLDSSIKKLSPMAEMSHVVSLQQEAVSLINSFDRTLTFENPFPENYPRVIGPHGDYDLTQDAWYGLATYLEESMLDIGYAFSTGKSPVWPTEATILLGEAWQAMGVFIPRWSRGAGLISEIILEDDQAIIESDTAHGSGLRPESFFRVLLAHEYFMMPEGVGSFVFGERTPQAGLPDPLQRMLNNSSQVEALVKKYNPNTTLEFKQGNFGIMWRKADFGSAFFVAFVYEIPAPPVGDPSKPTVIPANYFDSELQKLDSVLSDAQSVKDELTAKIGTSV